MIRDPFRALTTDAREYLMQQYGDTAHYGQPNHDRLGEVMDRAVQRALMAERDMITLEDLM